MNRSITLKAVALLALAAAAGLALSQAAFATAAWQFLTAHADVGALVLAWGPAVRKLQIEQVAAVDAMKAVAAKAEAEGRDLNEAEQAEFAKHKATSDRLKASIEREQTIELAEAGLDRNSAAAVAAQTAQPNTGTSVTIPASAIIRVSENVDQDPQRGFTSVGDFCRSVFGAAMAPRRGLQADARLAVLSGGGFNAAAPATYANEASGVDGGYLVPPAYATRIFGLSLEEQALLPMTDNMPVEGNGMSLPKDETTPWGSNGVRASWAGEAVAATATKPVLGRMELKLKKLIAFVPVSDELLSDATALAAYIPPNMARSIRWKSDEAILFGNGAIHPLGAFSSGAAVTVSKESGQSAATVVFANVAKMISRLMPGSFSRAVWLTNNDVLPQLFGMTLGNYPIYLPVGAGAGGAQTSPYGTLMGRPIMVSQHAKSIGTLGDLMLVDMSYYQAITKAEGISMATSMHFYFDADAAAFRATFRVDGQPKIAAPVSPANGSNTLSPFVQLEAR